MANRLNIVWLTHRLSEAQNKETILTSCHILGKHFRIPSLKDKACKMWIMCGSPFVAFLLFGQIFDLESTLLVKTILLIILLILSSCLVRFVFDDRMYNIMPIVIYLSTKFWLYVTFITYFFKCLYYSSIDFDFSKESSLLLDFNHLSAFGFVVISTLLFYSFYRTCTSDPGIVAKDVDQRYRVCNSHTFDSFLDLYQNYRQ